MARDIWECPPRCVNYRINKSQKGGRTLLVKIRKSPKPQGTIHH